MTLEDIKAGIDLICNTSSNVKSYYDSNEMLVNALNNVSKEDLKKCMGYYEGRSGVIVDLRKEVINYLLQDGKLTVEKLEKLISKHKSGKENQFRAYKQWFSIFYPPLTFYSHNPIRKFIEEFIEQIIKDLGLSDKVSSTYFDFQGARQQGSDRLWLAIYNINQESHSTSLQFFVEFLSGKVSYGVYRHSDQSYLKDKVTKEPAEFNYKEFLDYFKPEIDILLQDSPNAITEIPVNSVQKDISEKLTDNLNVILYGPPGTGKTYELSNYYFDKFTSKKSSITKEEFFKTFIMDKSWWEVIAMVLLDIGKAKVTDIYAHEILKAKEAISNNSHVNALIWSMLQTHTIDACDNVKYTRRMSPQIFNKTEDKLWEIIHEEVEQQSPDLLKYQNELNSFSEKSEMDIKRYRFTTFHQSFTYEDFVEGIKPDLSAEEGVLSYVIEDGVFKSMCNIARNDPDQNYAIFIDEINRGNISQIFGELITLIEDDKREGEDNELSATLPYSKTKLSVPSNLYIIGTMNTADRSVESLDTALRRRFSFIEMPPKPEIIKTSGKSNDGIVSGINMVKLLELINSRIERLLDKDHMIGHSYFMSVISLNDLKNVFQNKILPLLQEYFYGDFGKIGLVVGEGFVVSDNSEIDVNTFASFYDYDSSPFIDRQIYRVKNVAKMTDDEFIKAINMMS